ncbi:hypothetical protein IFM89_027544 [Coptis chinensis]|uniref:Glycosyltransferase 61 catalytic domain-containing protein n=1 Tax=Coptis chinensis TaxID=261450 RepID=A0A835HN00_9MAGN|nr:hypothetical protein IFM89_027544 [Coptis chinensis]
MEYNTIFAKSFSRHEQKKLGVTAFLGSLIILLSIFTVFRPSFRHLPILNLRVSMRAGLAMLMFEDTRSSPQESIPIKHAGEGGPFISLPAPFIAEAEEIKQEMKPVCNVFEERSDFCNIDGHIRVHGNSSTIYFASSQVGGWAGNESWRLRPYARKTDLTAMGSVTQLSVKPITANQIAPSCSVNHSVPAVVFSIGGYSGNHFHDFADILVPLYVTSRQFDGEVQFLITNVKAFWLLKYQTALKALSRYDIINMDKDNDVHCFPSVIVGLQYHTELIIDPSKSVNGYSMSSFREFLRSAYSLKRKRAIKISDRRRKKPRLLIVSRKRTRSFTNGDDIVKMAKSLGFAVVVAEPGMTGLSQFAQIVNSCDVMMGVHGAGLTNLVFLPTNAILIQIVPWGRLEWLSTHYFGEPAVRMNIRYMEYRIKEEESTLIQQYPRDHAVFKDPMSIHKQGWNALKSTFLDKQNVNLDVHWFRRTLLEALELLHH